jgi:hypothetical protein
MSISGGSATLRVDMYYSYDGTNFTTVGSSGNVTVSGSAPANYTYLVKSPSIISTNATGFMVRRDYVVVSTNGAPTLTIWAGGGTPSKITFNTWQSGVNLATLNSTVSAIISTQINAVAGFSLPVTIPSVAQTITMCATANVSGAFSCLTATGATTVTTCTMWTNATYGAYEAIWSLYLYTAGGSVTFSGITTNDGFVSPLAANTNVITFLKPPNGNVIKAVNCIPYKP